jgi:hypothetical protein
VFVTVLEPRAWNDTEASQVSASIHDRTVRLSVSQAGRHEHVALHLDGHTADLAAAAGEAQVRGTGFAAQTAPDERITP